MRSILPIFAAALLAAAPAAAQPVRRVQYVMGTLCDITAYGPSAALAESEAFAELARLDRALSLYKKDSDLSRLNAGSGTWFQASDALWEAVSDSLEYAKASGGAFDATILPVLREGPSALARVGYARVELDAAHRAVRLPSGGALDFGGIGKGLALDHAAKILRARGVASALINFGGQIYALGGRPDGSAWPVTIDGYPGTFQLKDASLSTSGNAERPGHIASPFTGERIMAKYSASVISPSATEADAWSTALFVRGPDAATGYPGCFVFSGSRPIQAPACSRYLGHD